ncbi:MAG: hypothetical protein SGI98_01450 [Verrucomicrobiota bacterium]|nr:hypothetical protein [Verrucomicrobiota bacterium]
MSEETDKLKTSLKLVQKHEASKPQVAAPAPLGSSPQNAPLPPTPPSLGVPPITPSQDASAVNITEANPEMTNVAKPWAKLKSSGGLNKILLPVIALLVGLGLGAGGVFFMLSSKHEEAVADLQKEIDKAKKSATTLVSEEKKKTTEAEAATKASEEKARIIEEKIKAESADLLARKDVEIKIAKTSAAIAANSKREAEQLKAQMEEMEKTMADAVALAVIERKEKERLRYIAQQYQTEMKKFNPKFSPSAPPASQSVPTPAPSPAATTQ